MSETISIITVMVFTFIAGMVVGIWWHTHEHPWRDFQKMVIDHMNAWVERNKE